MKYSSAFVLTTLLTSCAALAAPVKYTIDSNHTYPSFSADHMGGLSTLRGKFNKSTGSIVLDKEAQTGSLDVTIDTTSIDFGHDRLNEHAKSPDMFDVAKFPTATYTGKLTSFANGMPTAVEGSLSLHGVTKPVTLKIDSFKCMPHPRSKKEVCGANASGTINRKDFGVSYGEQMGFDMNVGLNIEVEASLADAAT
jgi:polyisoprenoid-binding protein YceI